MVEIYPVRFTKDDLSSVPDEELLFHLLLAQITNEILILRKQLMLASNSIREPGAQAYAAAAMAHFNLRLLAGKLFEGYQLLRRKEAGSVYQSFKKDLESFCSDAHREIMRYFGKSNNNIERLRNKSSFHWDYDTNKAAFEGIADEEELIDFISYERGNSFYHSGYVLSMTQMARVIGRADVGPALDAIYEEVSRVGDWFASFADGMMFAFAERHLSPSKEMFEGIEQKLEGCPDILTAGTAYFFDTSSLTPEVLERLAGLANRQP
jgi:hypothetical protein